MNATLVLVGSLGAGLVVATLVDAFEVMLLPRRVHRRLRFVRGYFRTTWNVWTAIAGRLRGREARGTFLSLYGPLSMIGLFAVWFASLIVGFALVQWALAGGARSLFTQLYFSGETFFTLGYGDVTAPTRAGRALSVCEAGIGFGIIAIVIGYLPVLYQLFSRREAFVIRLDARAGSPPTAAELLARHADSAAGLASLGDLLVECERWAAELLESHLSYPMLAYYRSQHDNESWLAALTAVLDGCALLTVGLRDVPRVAAASDGALDGTPDHAARGAGVAAALPTFQGRMTFATARLAMVEMSRALHLGPEAAGDADGPPPSERLPPVAFDRLCARLDEVGLALGDLDARRRLDAIRATYEPFVVALATRLVQRVPRWVAYDDAVDNWER